VSTLIALRKKIDKGTEPGTVLPIAVVASNATIASVHRGGSLFLVAARPKERVWLVAILERPRRA
jgi:hypothetical protein